MLFFVKMNPNFNLLPLGCIDHRPIVVIKGPAFGENYKTKIIPLIAGSVQAAKTRSQASRATRVSDVVLLFCFEVWTSAAFSPSHLPRRRLCTGSRAIVFFLSRTGSFSRARCVHGEACSRQHPINEVHRVFTLEDSLATGSRLVHLQQDYLLEMQTKNAPHVTTHFWFAFRFLPNPDSFFSSYFLT